MQADIKHPKQRTLGNLVEAQNVKPPKTTVPEQKKQIEITERGAFL